MKVTQWGYIGKPWNRVVHIAIDGDTACGLPGIAMNRYQNADAKPVCLNCLKAKPAHGGSRKKEGT